jgi:hypothetical protein
MSVDGIWYVKLDDGDVERVTLDQLDEWFQSGRIDEKSLVLADGADQWMKLADLLGLSDTADQAETAPATPVAVAAAAGLVPAAPVPQATAQPAYAAPPAAPVMATPVATGYVAAPAQGPVMATAVATLQGIPAIAVAPVAARPTAAPAMTSAPVAQPQRFAVPGGHPGTPIMGMRPPVVPHATPMVASVRPFSVDLGSVADLGDVSFRKSSRKGWVIGGVVAALAAGVAGFIVMTQSSASSQPEPAPVFAAAAASPPPTPTTTPDPVAPASSPDTPSQRGVSSIMDPTQGRLTDDQRKKLLEADKKSKMPVSTSGPSTWHAPKEKPSSFTTSGNKYDPLNSSL